MNRHLIPCRLALVAALVPAARALATPPAYSLVGSYASPGPIFDIAPDGRMYVVSGNMVLRQDTVNGSTFQQVAQLPAGSINSFGASFIRFSPDGHKLAIGDGNFSSSASVYVIDADSLAAAPPSTGSASVLTTITTPNFDAVWNTSAELFISGARSSDFVPVVNRVNISSPSASVSTVITNTGLASGGVAIRSGQLYVGSGFLPTGEVRRFDVASLSVSSALPFTSGALVGSFLSASPLAFDNLGNLLAGGGDTFSGTSDTGYAAIIDLNDPTSFQRLAPAGSATSYGVAFNHATSELLVSDSASNTIYRYAIPPAPSAALMGLGVLAIARRRRP